MNAVIDFLAEHGPMLLAGVTALLGAACIGVGSSMVTKEAMAKGDWGTIAANARAFVNAVAQARGK